MPGRSAARSPNLNVTGNACIYKVVLNDLFNRLAWKYFFINSDDNENIYDPNFAVRQTYAVATGDPGPFEVEEAFGDAVAELYRQLTAIAPDVRQSNGQSRAELSTLERYLLIEGLILKQSEKNLDLYLVKQDWYLEDLSNMLNNDLCYQEVTLDFVQQENSHLGNRLGTKEMGLFPPAHRKFLRDAFSGFPEFNWPRIHGIPKDHKQPLKIWPIVACHSHLAKHAFKVLSHIC